MNDRPAPARADRSTRVLIHTIAPDGLRSRSDEIVVEEPLAIHVACAGDSALLAVTMRTPGNDLELAAGFAYSDGVVRSPDDLEHATTCDDVTGDARGNAVMLHLGRDAYRRARDRARRLPVSSACGLCGDDILRSLADQGIEPLDDDLRITPELIVALPERMRAAQRVFAETGGLHAAALFDATGTLIALREDVGRHNAVDKIVGMMLLARRLPARGTMLMVSGRAGYEIVQKAIVARIPVVAAVSAPSSLAVATARAFGLTLCGFVRPPRANVYAGEQRVIVPATRSG